MSELRQTLLWGQTSIDRVRSFLHFADFKCPERRRCPARYPGPSAPRSLAPDPR